MAHKDDDLMGETEPDDVLFAGAKAGSKLAKAQAAGVPVLDEAALLVMKAMALHPEMVAGEEIRDLIAFDARTVRSGPA